jgi:hypothetical protein
VGAPAGRVAQLSNIHTPENPSLPGRWPLRLVNGWTTVGCRMQAADDSLGLVFRYLGDENLRFSMNRQSDFAAREGRGRNRHGLWRPPPVELGRVTDGSARGGAPCGASSMASPLRPLR